MSSRHNFLEIRGALAGVITVLAIAGIVICADQIGARLAGGDGGARPRTLAAEQNVLLPPAEREPVRTRRAEQRSAAAPVATAGDTPAASVPDSAVIADVPTAAPGTAPANDGDGGDDDAETEREDRSRRGSTGAVADRET